LWACRVRFLPLGPVGGFQLGTRPPIFLSRGFFLAKNRRSEESSRLIRILPDKYDSFVLDEI
jgi:hypothetical protein